MVCVLWSVGITCLLTHTILSTGHEIGNVYVDLLPYLTSLKLQIFIVIIQEGVVKTYFVPSVSSVAATTFYYNAIKDWHSLPAEVKIKGSYNGFKGAAKTYLRTHLQLSEADNFVYY